MKRPTDLAGRGVTVVIGVPAAVALVWLAPAGVFASGIGLVTGMAAWEFAGLLGITTLRGRLAAAAGGGLLPVALHLSAALPPFPDRPTQLAVVGVMLCMVVIARAAIRRMDSPAPSPLTLLACVLYPAAGLGTMIVLRFETGGPAPGWVLLAMAACWGGDIGAYLVGATVGRHPLAPGISPRKTVEGSVASVIAALILAWAIAGAVLPAVSGWRILPLALGANLAGQVGDLFESSLKRARGVKDSWWLDTLDGLAFATPLLYLARGI